MHCLCYAKIKVLVVVSWRGMFGLARLSWYDYKGQKDYKNQKPQYECSKVAAQLLCWAALVFTQKEKHHRINGSASLYTETEFRVNMVAGAGLEPATSGL